MEAITIRASTINITCEAFICEFALTIFAITLEPPALEFPFMINPTPKPTTAPPKIEATKIFEISKSKFSIELKRSVKTEISKIVITVFIANIFPKYFIPQRRSGILIKTIDVPIDKFVR
eukprot:TRINITY_DN247946_c0_g1_i1.p2 TRINITY_DN247946_c0_g1~~TRINITY_DN247946_c0_g1_i1.p2  ORF type:complete len:120 (+),score=5.74 TRINITY_DN247946_c0_g1_i1:146-505(+)